jgi:hypothetical protein
MRRGRRQRVWHHTGSQVFCPFFYLDAAIIRITSIRITSAERWRSREGPDLMGKA